MKQRTMLNAGWLRRVAGRMGPRLALTVALLLCVGLWWTVVDVAGQAADDEAAPNGYAYTVREGDFWGRIAQLTGVSEAAIREANPDAQRPDELLLLGETLFIPTGDVVANRFHTVQSGESWNSIADRYGLRVELLRATNPQAARLGNILFRGEQLFVPPSPADLASGAPVEPGETVTGTTTVTPTTVAVVVPTAAPTATPAPTTTAAPTATAAPTTGPTPAPTATAVEEEPEATAVADEEADAVATAMPEEEDTVAFDLPACPQRFAEYPALMTSLINTESPGPDAVVAFLEACDALVEAGVAQVDLTGDGKDDLVVVYINPSAEQIFVESDLVIFNSSAGEYALSYRARAAGEVRLLTVEDINADDLPDVVWVDTTCGASTCFDTVNVRSWDGSLWADWTEGTITMAYAEISLVESAAQGQDIVLEGGIYGSVGAGPQRSRSEVWSSVDGAPYALVEKTYSRSECLYHTVLDANRAFLDAPDAGFEAAIALYTRAADDTSLLKCWVRPDELSELRSFSRFRLALIAGYQGDVEAATAQVDRLTTDYPDSVYTEAATLWLARFGPSGSAAAACSAVTTFAEANPAAWEVLADYGYTNPSFEAADVCPVLDVGPADGTDEESDEEAADEAASSASSAGDIPLDPDLAVVAACPATLEDYAGVLPTVLAVSAAQDPALVERWLQACGAIGPDRGAVVWAELDDDGSPDAIVFPSFISDLGYGPGGAQGTVLIFHAEAGGTYTLIAAPDIPGLPMPLAVDDLNADGRVDIAWTITACGEACVLSVHIYTWDGDAYVALIGPGAAIAEGEASFAPVAAGDPGSGQQLILDGGVSLAPEAGLPTPHREVWQSIAGGIYQRLSWQYDGDAPGGDCLGLRLVEADVALEAAVILGYGVAIDLYATALDPAWTACSLFDLPAAQELTLLQGLAAFRLLQAQALSGNLDAAEQTLLALTTLQPDGGYTTVAATWLAEFDASASPTQACAAVREFFSADPLLWQVTDHFGYNHPALGPDQICFVP